MSGALAECAWRNLTVLALHNRTWAGSNVSSSKLNPINELKPGDYAGAVVVFTDEARTDDSQIDGNDLFSAQSVVTLALEIGCIGAVPKEAGNDGAATWMPDSDEGYELTIDVIRRQALVELQTGNSIWAKLWRDCRVKTSAIYVARGSAIEKGVRSAFKRCEMRCQLIADPVPGRPLPKFWVDCLAAFDTHPSMQDIAKTLRSLAEGDAMPEWRSTQAELGLTDDGVRGLGIVPSDDAGPADELTVVVSSGAGQPDIEISVDADEATVKVGDGDPVVVAEAVDG
jgi:hypothetical protein